ncbi:MAG: YggT family protein [Candidatus Omnitrophica bacterium]|nr:YggT family protein [Candidatus Omnitrophota bacterium]
MFVLANFIEAVALVLRWVMDVLWWLIIIRAVLSWVNADPANPIVQFIERVTEPLLLPFRKIIPAYKLGIDLSPVFALLLLYFLRIFLVQTLLEVALRLK